MNRELLSIIFAMLMVILILSAVTLIVLLV